MKKFIIIVLILIFCYFGYIIYDKYINNDIPKLTIEEEKIDIDNLIIYGTHLNLSGNIIPDDNFDLVLYDGDFLSYNINITNNGFNLSNNINEGLYLEDIPIGTYYLFLRDSSVDTDNKVTYKYYALNNVSGYDETIYYTFSNIGNKIVINSDEEYHTLVLNVSKNNDDNFYDVVIDPGHGGLDSGAIVKGHKEADYTIKIATKLKEEMEKKNIKVKLTREKGQLSDNDIFEAYGKGGRAVISHEVKAKYVFSIHLNSNNSSLIHGLEVYTADNINYDFAKELVKNITSQANTTYSTNKTNKVFDGLYTRTFTEKDIQESLTEYENKKLNAYEITTNSNYYYMIRETGGIMTGAYVDDRNEPSKGTNPYYNSNIGAEAYLLELGYLTNDNDLKNIDENMDKYSIAIANTFYEYFILK